MSNKEACRSRGPERAWSCKCMLTSSQHLDSNWSHENQVCGAREGSRILRYLEYLRGTQRFQRRQKEQTTFAEPLHCAAFLPARPLPPSNCSTLQCWAEPATPSPQHRKTRCWGSNFLRNPGMKSFFIWWLSQLVLFSPSFCKCHDLHLLITEGPAAAD